MENKFDNNIFSFIFDNFYNPVFICKAEKKEIIKVNKAAIEKFGYSNEEFLTMTMFDLLYEINVENLKEKEKKILECGKDICEIKMKTKNNKILFIEMHCTLFNYDSTQFIICYIDDKTEKIELEKEYKKLIKALEQSSNVIVITDINGNIEYVNPAFEKLTGYRVDEAIGKNPRILKSGYHDNEFYKILWNTIKSGAVWEGEFLNLKKDGTKFWEAATITPVKNEKNEIVNFICVKEDITKRKELIDLLNIAKEKADEANRLKSEFLANMSHEIRTPMNAILGFTDILLEEEKDENKKEYLKLIKQSGNNLLNLLNDIIDFSKIESGKIEIEYREFNLKHLLSHIYNMFKIKAEEKKIDLQLIIDDNVPDNIFLDELRLNQIIVNLVSNAIKFTEKGYVKIHCNREDNNLVISISDTGIGISSDKISKIFKPFEQGDSSISRKYGGTGLGLTITKKLVELMKGQILVKSKENEGSTFKVLFKIEEGKKEKRIVNLEIRKKFENILKLSSDDIINKWINNPKIKNEEIKKILIQFLKNLIEKDIKQLENAIKISKESDIKFLCNNLLISTEKLGLEEITEILKLILSEIYNENYRIELISELFLILKEIINKISESIEIKKVETTIKRKLRILVAADNLTNQKLIGLYLKKLGEEADLAENGKQVLELLEKKEYDLIFLDIQMPIMDGVQTIKELKSNEKYKNIYTIALTAHALKGDAEKYISYGFDDYMSKPLDLNKIQEKINKVFLLVQSKKPEKKEDNIQCIEIKLNEAQKEKLIEIINELEKNIKIFSPSKIKKLANEIILLDEKHEYFKKIKNDLYQIADRLNEQKLFDLIQNLKEKIQNEKK
ncbi:MAG TPA: PAS domain S-box protein [bacterium]|nr:PAS domain S-box protein [bacterium]